MPRRRRVKGDQHAAWHGSTDSGRRHCGDEQPGRRRQGTGGRPARRRSATWSWSATPVRARPRSSRPCSSRPGRSRGPVGSRTAPRCRDFDEAEVRQQRSVGLALAPLSSATASRSTCWTPPATPTSSATCAPGCARPTPRCSSSRRSTAIDGATQLLWEECAAVGHAARRRRHQAGPRRAPTSTRPWRSASASSARACCRCTCRCWPTTARRPACIGLLSQRIYDYSSGHAGRARARTPSTCELIEGTRGALIEGIIAESEDETLMDRYLDGEEHRPRHADRRPGDGRRPRLVLPRARHGGRARRPRHGRAARRSCTAGFPSPAGAPAARRSPTPDGPAARPADLRPGRPAVRRGRQDDDRPLRRAAVAWCASSPARCARTPSSTSPGTSRLGEPRARGPRRRRADRRAVSSPLGKVQRTVDAGGRRRHRARSPSSPGPRPATPCPTRTTRCSWSRG